MPVRYAATLDMPKQRQPDVGDDATFRRLEAAGAVAALVQSYLFLDGFEDEVAQPSVRGGASQRLAITFLFCKAHETYQAIQLLYKSRFYPDALILVRAVFECSLQVRYLQQDPRRAKRFERYLASRPRERILWLLQQGYVGVAKGLEATDTYRGLRAELDALAPLHQQYHWWGKSVRWLAHQLGGLEAATYDVLYADLSEFAHSGAGSFGAYAAFERSGISFRAGPDIDDESGLQEAAALTARSIMIALCRDVDKALGLGVEKVVGDIVASYDA